MGSSLDSTMHTVYKKAVQVNNPLDRTERIMAVVCDCVRPIVSHTPVIVLLRWP